MKWFARLDLVVAIALPCATSGQDSPQTGRGQPTAQELIRLRDLYAGGSREILPPTAPLLDDRLLRTVLLPNRALAAWAVERLRPDPTPVRVGELRVLGNVVEQN